MRSLRLSSRWNATRSTLSVPSRIEIRPPSLRHAPASPWQRLLFWLAAPAQDAAPPLNRLPRVRAAFVGVLSDLEAGDARSLSGRAAAAGSLRELWHLRAEVYRLVAIHHSQHEAEERLASLNKHFPKRAPRPALVAQ